MYTNYITEEHLVPYFVHCNLAIAVVDKFVLTQSHSIDNCLNSPLHL